MMKQSVKHKKLDRMRPFDWGIVAICLVMIIMVIYPLWYVFINSISNVELVSNGLINFLPKDIDFGAYLLIGCDKMFWRSVCVTIALCLASAALKLFCTVALSYPLIRSNLMFRKAIVAFLILSMYVNGGLIPSYILMNKIGFYNTPLALIMPGAVSVGNVMLLRVYMKSIGQELMDAAFVDGATNFQTLFKIVVPLSKPCMVVLALQEIIAMWNSWFNANIYMPGRKWQPVQLYLSRMLDGMNILNTGDMNYLATLGPGELERLEQDVLAACRIEYATMLLVAAPLLIMYPFVQKDLQQGIMVGSLKE